MWGLAGGLVAAVGLALLAAAAVEALAPLMRSAALRLLLVGAPLFAAGAVLILLALRVPAGAAPDHADDHRQEGQGQDHVRPGAERITAHQPQHQ